MYQKTLFAIVSSLIIFSMSVSATTITAQADSFVVASSPNSSDGSNSELRVKNAASSDGSSNVNLSASRKIYIQFNLSGLSQSIANASFSLVDEGGSGGNPVSGLQTFNIFGLNDGVSGENWTESTLTWNNAPANNTTSRSGVTSSATLLGQFTINGTGNQGDLIQFSGASLDSFLNQDTNGLATLIVSRDTFHSDHSGFIHTFASREHPSLAAPSLNFDEVAIPEPSTILFLSIALGALFVRRK